MRTLPAEKTFRSYTLATIFIEQGKDREAETILRELLNDNPGNIEIKSAFEGVLKRLGFQENDRLSRLLRQWVRLLILRAQKRRLEDIVNTGIGIITLFSVKERKDANER